MIDAGSGYGDFARKLDGWASKRGLPIEIACVDMNPWSRRAAEEATLKEGRCAASRPTSSIIRLKAAPTSSSALSLHITCPMRFWCAFYAGWKRTAARGWFINDLERHPLPYYFLRLAFWVTRHHRFMQHDGPVSVASAFKRRDWMRYLAEAGIPQGLPALGDGRLTAFAFRV